MYHAIFWYTDSWFWCTVIEFGSIHVLLVLVIVSFLYTDVAYSVFQRYDPTKALFKHVSKINSYLLQDIVDCYKKSKNICRTCYYKQNKIEQLSVPNRFCKHCKKVAAPLLLIPASKMCDNLAGSSTVAIPPPPKMLMAKINR